MTFMFYTKKTLDLLLHSYVYHTFLIKGNYLTNSIIQNSYSGTWLTEKHKNKNKLHSPLQSFWLTLLLLFGVIDSNIVIQHNQQEQWHAKHVGKYSQLHVRHHSAENKQISVKESWSDSKESLLSLAWGAVVESSWG